VTRAEIREALWPGGEFVEFEHAINTAMRKIRSVLEDEAERPRLIETLPRKGYRFIAPVEVVENVSAEAEHTEVEDKETPRSPVATPELEIALQGSHARGIFLFIQLGYLAMYYAALLFSSDLNVALSRAGFTPVWFTEPATIVVAMCGIAVRLYLLSSVGLRHPNAGKQFHKLFPFVFVLDALWAASPLLVAPTIGIGVALAGACGLAYLPFSQRTLIRTMYPPG
jgi:cholera toxin transcriptional activator